MFRKSPRSCVSLNQISEFINEQPTLGVFLTCFWYVTCPSHWTHLFPFQEQGFLQHFIVQILHRSWKIHELYLAPRKTGRHASSHSKGHAFKEWMDRLDHHLVTKLSMRGDASGTVWFSSAGDIDRQKRKPSGFFWVGRAERKVSVSRRQAETWEEKVTAGQTPGWSYPNKSLHWVKITLRLYYTAGLVSVALCCLIRQRVNVMEINLLKAAIQNINLPLLVWCKL